MFKLQLLAILLIIMGGLNWGTIGVFKYNFVEKILPKEWDRGVYVIVGLAALFLLFQRDIWLPFLGWTVFPTSQLNNNIPNNATISKTVKVDPGAQVVYWASESVTNSPSASSSALPGPDKAYGNYSNSGVVTADAQGNATLRVRKPQPYEVGWWGQTLDPHIHYRVSNGKGILSSVFTISSQ